jgi:hypothetical protein
VRGIRRPLTDEGLNDNISLLKFADNLQPPVVGVALLNAFRVHVRGVNSLCAARHTTPRPLEAPASAPRMREQLVGLLPAAEAVRLVASGVVSRIVASSGGSAGIWQNGHWRHF